MPLEALPGASFSEALARYLHNLFIFSGTASRSEFWKVVLFWLVAWLVIGTALIAFWGFTIVNASPPAGYAPSSPWEMHEFRVWLGIVGSFGLFWVLFTIFNAGLGFRRLQDAGMPGWLFWFCFIPPGLFAVLVLCAVPPRTVPTPSN